MFDVHANVNIYVLVFVDFIAFVEPLRGHFQRSSFNQATRFNVAGLIGYFTSLAYIQETTNQHGQQCFRACLDYILIMGQRHELSIHLGLET